MTSRAHRVLPTTLYRLYDAEDRLLYIGITAYIGQRFAQHSRERSWWGDVERWTGVEFPNRWTAQHAETEAIQQEKPLHNLSCNPSHPAYASTYTVGTLPRAACPVCTESHTISSIGYVRPHMRALYAQDGRLTHYGRCPGSSVRQAVS